MSADLSPAGRRTSRLHPLTMPCSHPGARLYPWSHNTSNLPAGEAWPGSSAGTARIQDRSGLAELSLLQQAHTRDDSSPFALALCNDEHLRITSLGHAKGGCRSETGITPPEIIPKMPQVKQNINSLACCRQSSALTHSEQQQH